MFPIVIGLNHKTAPVDVREKLAFPQKVLGEALAKLKNTPYVEGCAILSTCNRTEVYAAVTDAEKGLMGVQKFLSAHAGLEMAEIRKYLYSRTLYEAVRHLFRVAAGLDSMVLGETQILGQVREAYQWACEYGASNNVLNSFFQQSVTVGKRVRTETDIDRHAVSISYAAIELAKQVFGDLTGKSTLVIGAGEMSELTLKHLIANGVSTVKVANRSYDRAVCLAGQFGGEAVRFERMFDNMAEADIVVSCTAATHCIIYSEDMERVMAARGGRTIFMIDIALPRDIDPLVGSISGVHLYDIDSLQHVVDQNLDDRRREAVKAEKIIEEEIDQFLKWLSTLFVVPTVVALKEKGEAIKEAELNRALNRLGNISDRERKIISSLANSIVNQLLHEPITQLKELATTHQGHLYTEICQNLFNLEVRGQRPKHRPAEGATQTTHS